MKKAYKKLSISEIVGYTLLCGTALLFLFSLLTSGWDSSSLKLLLRVLCRFVIFIIPVTVFFLLLKKEGYKLPETHNKLSYNQTAMLSLSGGGLILITEFLYRAVFPDTAVSIDLAGVQNGWAFFLYFVQFAVVPAIFEEIFFRGLVLRALTGYHSMLAILMSALVFGLMHFSIEAFPLIFFVGLIAGCIYYATRSVGIAIAIHFSTNAVWFLEKTVLTYMPENYTFFIRVMVVTATLFVLLGLSILKKTVDSILVEEKDGAVIPATGFWNLPIILFLILSIALQLLVGSL